ncbi:hypothetical protein GCM10009716_40180 [Streptomyces sodiiphilus]|uniref:Type II toxin-antitoxin system RelE/ParE family toxin n=1 Tax=Streptomyces sodiiphilus TaxID=226217 RepID=A0ABP5B2G6_9ACTN
MTDSYRVQFAPVAEAAVRDMTAGHRARFDAGIRALAVEPYGNGSTAIREERDYRQAAVGGALIVYYVSTSVLLITVVRAVH